MDLDAEFDKMYGSTEPTQGNADLDAEFDKMYGDDGGAATPVKKRAPWGLRPDGTPKGSGYFGVLKNANGDDVTEYSVGVNIDGKEMGIPTLVPTLNDDEKQQVLDASAGLIDLPEGIVKKAEDFARSRMAKGKSVWADKNDSFQVPITTADEAKAKGALGITETAQKDYEAATGIDAPKNGFLAQVANMGLTVGGRLMAETQMRAAQKLMSGDYDPKDEDSLMDELIYGAVAQLRQTDFSLIPGRKKITNKILKEWDDSIGRQYKDPAERLKARKAYAQQIATNLVKERTGTQQNAETELANRDVTHSANIVSRGLGMVGYTLPYALGPLGITLQFLEEGSANAVGYKNDKYGYDDDGNFVLVSKGDSTGRSMFKGFSNAGFETATELAGGKIGGAVVKRLGKWGGQAIGALAGKTIGKIPLVKSAGAAISKTTGKLVDKFEATKAGQALERFGSTLLRGSKWMSKKFHLESYPEENIEEWESALFNALTGFDRRDSELIDPETGERTNPWGRFVDANKEFFSLKNMTELNEAMLLSMGVGAFIAKCAQRGTRRNVDNLIRMNGLMTEEEIKKTSLDKKAAALDAWMDGLSEEQVVEKLNKATSWVDKLSEKIAGESGKYTAEVNAIREKMAASHAIATGKELAELKIPEQKFNIKTKQDKNGKVVPDFQRVKVMNVETGETMECNAVYDESGIRVVDNGSQKRKSGAAYTVFVPGQERGRNFRSLDKAITYATQAKNDIALDMARDNMKVEFINKIVEKDYGGANIICVKTAAEAVDAAKKRGYDVTQSDAYDAGRAGWHLPDGTTILVRDNISSPLQAEQLLRHENIGHSEEMMKDKWLNAGEKSDIGKLRDANIENAVKTNGRVSEAEVDRIKRESVANTIGENPHVPTVGDRVIHGIREALRKVGLNINEGDVDMDVVAAGLEKAMRKSTDGSYVSVEAVPLSELVQIVAAGKKAKRAKKEAAKKAGATAKEAGHDGPAPQEKAANAAQEVATDNAVAPQEQASESAAPQEEARDNARAPQEEEILQEEGKANDFENQRPYTGKEKSDEARTNANEESAQPQSAEAQQGAQAEKLEGSAAAEGVVNAAPQDKTANAPVAPQDKVTNAPAPQENATPQEQATNAVASKEQGETHSSEVASDVATPEGNLGENATKQGNAGEAQAIATESAIDDGYAAWLKKYRLKDTPARRKEYEAKKAAGVKASAAKKAEEVKNAPKSVTQNAAPKAAVNTKTAKAESVAKETPVAKEVPKGATPKAATQKTEAPKAAATPKAATAPKTKGKVDAKAAAAVVKEFVAKDGTKRSIRQVYHDKKNGVVVGLNRRIMIVTKYGFNPNAEDVKDFPNYQTIVREAIAKRSEPRKLNVDKTMRICKEAIRLGKANRSLPATVSLKLEGRYGLFNAEELLPVLKAMKANGIDEVYEFGSLSKDRQVGSIVARNENTTIILMPSLKNGDLGRPPTKLGEAKRSDFLIFDGETGRLVSAPKRDIEDTPSYARGRTYERRVALENEIDELIKEANNTPEGADSAWLNKAKAEPKASVNVDAKAEVIKDFVGDKSNRPWSQKPYHDKEKGVVVALDGRVMIVTKHGFDPNAENEEGFPKYEKLLPRKDNYSETKKIDVDKLLDICKKAIRLGKDRRITSASVLLKLNGQYRLYSAQGLSKVLKAMKAYGIDKISEKDDGSSFIFARNDEATIMTLPMKANGVDSTFKELPWIRRGEKIDSLAFDGETGRIAFAPEREVTEEMVKAHEGTTKGEVLKRQLAKENEIDALIAKANGEKEATDNAVAPQEGGAAKSAVSEEQSKARGSEKEAAKPAPTAPTPKAEEITEGEQGAAKPVAQEESKSLANPAYEAWLKKYSLKDTPAHRAEFEKKQGQGGAAKARDNANTAENKKQEETAKAVAPTRAEAVAAMKVLGMDAGLPDAQLKAKVREWERHANDERVAKRLDAARTILADRAAKGKAELSAEDKMEKALAEAARRKSAVDFDSPEYANKGVSRRVTPEEDAAYLDAVKRGDMETAKQLLKTVWERNGYAPEQTYMGRHAAPWATVPLKDFKNKEELKDQSEFGINLWGLANGIEIQPEDFFFNWRYAGNNDMWRHVQSVIGNAIKDIQKGRDIKVKVYRAVPKDVAFHHLQSGGQWVTPIREYAVMHGESQFGENNYHIIEQDVAPENLWWDGSDMDEWGYDDGKQYVYQNAPNGMKLAAVTYDDAGNIIPLSERFNQQKEDIRFDSPEYARKEDIRAFLEGKPVAKATGHEYEGMDKDSIEEKAYEKFEKRNRSVINPELGKVALTRNSVRNTLAKGMGRAKLSALDYVPVLIEQGRIVKTNNNWKERGYNTAVIAAPIDIGSKRYAAFVVVRQYPNKDNNFYLHEVGLIDEMKNRANGLRSGLSEDGEVDPSIGSVRSIAYSLYDDKGENENNNKNADKKPDDIDFDSPEYSRSAEERAKEVKSYTQRYYSRHKGLKRLEKPSAEDFMDAAEGRWSKFRRAVQDKNLVIHELEKRLGITDKKDSVYYAKDREFGLNEWQLDALDREFIQPIFEKLAATGASQQDLDLYLMARHAPSRNAILRTRGVENGSGMTDAEAADVLKHFREIGIADEFDEIAKMVYAMNEQALQRRVDSGRMSADDAAKLRRQFKDYVPLRTDMENDERDAHNTYSSGWHLNEFHMAKGRKTLADSPLSWSIVQAERSIKDANANMVRQVAAKLVRTASELGHPIGEIIPGRQVKNRWAFQLGTEVLTLEELRDRPDLIFFKEDGKLKAIRMFTGEHGLGNTFAKAVTDKDLARFNKWFEWVPKVTRFFSAMRTQYVPTFIVRNLKADHIEVLLNSLTERGFKGGAEFFGRLLKCEKQNLKDVRAFFRRGELNGRMKEFVENGGLTGGGMSAEGFTEVEKRLASTLKDAKRNPVQKAFGAMGDLISWLNACAEYNTRVAVFSALREQGVGVEDAVSYARDATVNFNRKGFLTPYINAAYMFSNASIQGLGRALKPLREHPKRAAGTLGALFLLGMIQGFIDNFVGRDDDDKEKEKEGEEPKPQATGLSNVRNLSEYSKQSEVAFPMGKTGLMLKARVRNPFALPIYLGRKSAEYITGQTSAKKAVSDLASAVGGFVTEPVGGNGLGSVSEALQTLAPTMIDPFVQWATGTDFAGTPRVKRNYSDYKPDSFNGRNATPAPYKWLAQSLNSLSGGNEFRKGALDTAPENWQLLVETALGGVLTDIGRTISAAQDAWQIAKGEKPDQVMRDIPFVRDWITNYPDVKNRYYETLKEYEADKAEYKGLEKDGKSDAEQDAFVKAHNWVDDSDLDKIKKDIKNIGKEIQEWKRQDNEQKDGEQEKQKGIRDLERDQLALMEDFVRQMDLYRREKWAKKTYKTK